MTEIDENILPEELKGRLSKDDKYNLFVKCDEKTITIENYNGHHDNVLKRKDGNYLCVILGPGRIIFRKAKYRCLKDRAEQKIQMLN